MGQHSEMPDNSCRLCDENCTAMHSVFEIAPEGQQILHMIKDCLRILIYRTDPLPKQICESCYRNLLNFSSFKKIVHETLERQTEKLHEYNSENNVSVRLFLNTLEQENSQLRDISRNSQTPDNNESELCAQLQKAIKESLQYSKIQENHIAEEDEEKLINGHNNEMLDDDDFDGRDAHSTDSPFCFSQNADTNSDMELCDSDVECSPKIITRTITGKRVLLDSGTHTMAPPSKKRRFIGPKSKVKEMQDNYLRLLHEQAVKENKKEVIVRYNPLSLLLCVLNHINKQNVPDFICEHYERTEIETLAGDPWTPNPDTVLTGENSCNYCNALFLDENSLAAHESTHMYVVLGQKVDEENPSLCSKPSEESMSELIDDRRTKECTPKDFDDSTGHVDVLDPCKVEFQDDTVLSDQDGSGNVFKGEVVLIDTKATVSGIPLSEIPKDDRRTLYKTVMVSGIKRKFCSLCRYTFKDNWAIESHYFSTACHYTCRFCGVRFNKQRNEFDNHIKSHILNGDVHTTKIFSSRKFYSMPRVINENKVKPRPPPPIRQPSPQPAPSKQPQPSRSRASRNKTERKSIVAIKQEPKSGSASPVPSQEGKPQNQAYFCRKCYKVFFKLDEFNVHVVTCKGTGVSNNILMPPITRHSPEKVEKPEKPEKPKSNLGFASDHQEKFSPTGRPMRNCVKEVSTYADEISEDLDVHSKKNTTMGKSERGFECSMCSSCFPTIHSRNSHMRIHKSTAQLSALNKKSVNITRNRSENIAKKVANIVEKRNIPTFAKYVNNVVKVKQEPMEPIVEIHEQAAPNNYPSSIGSVSITPIPNSSHKTTLDPNIMKLVQNNPNLTIKTLADQKNSQKSRDLSPATVQQSSDGENRYYRCLSCSKPFANKSNLYFHKKNQCSGSKYPCPFCKKRFGTEAAYSSHIFYNHPE